MMSSSARQDAAASGSVRLALACIAGWMIATACAAWVGVWGAIGGAALVLGAAAWTFDRDGARASLRPTWRLVVGGAVVGGLMMAGTEVAYTLLLHLAPGLLDGTKALYSAFRVLPTPMAALALAPVVVGEELVWRGAVQTVVVGRFGRSAGFAVAALLYALAHAPFGSPLLVLAALLCGLAWGGLRALSGSLLPTLVAHLVWDFWVLLCFPLVPR